jgi:hypothetical protein
MGRVTIDISATMYPNVLTGIRVEKGVVESHERLGLKVTEQSKAILVSEVKTFVRILPGQCRSTGPGWRRASFTQDARGRYGAEGKRLDPDSSNYDVRVHGVAHM